MNWEIKGISVFYRLHEYARYFDENTRFIWKSKDGLIYFATYQNLLDMAIDSDMQPTDEIIIYGIPVDNE